MLITQSYVGLDLIGSATTATLLKGTAADVQRFRSSGRLTPYQIDSYFLYDKKEVEALAAVVFEKRAKKSEKGQLAKDLKEAREKVRGKKEGDISLEGMTVADYWHLIQVSSRWGTNLAQTEKVLSRRGTQIYFYRGERYILRTDFTILTKEDKTQL